MATVLCVIVVLAIIMALALWSVVEYSKPAPEWVEEDELRRHGGA